MSKRGYSKKYIYILEFLSMAVNRWMSSIDWPVYSTKKAAINRCNALNAEGEMKYRIRKYESAAVQRKR